MESVEKLREYIEKTKSCISPMCRRNILIISDEIEQEHKNELLLYRNAGYKDGYNEGFASIDDWCADNADELREHGWVRLLKDADGEYIYVGDMMDCGEHFGIQEVEGFIHGAVAFTVCDPQPARICTCPAHMTRHYHAPTVEDVLTEFAAKLIERGELTNGAAQTIAEYATKLQLRED